MAFVLFHKLFWKAYIGSSGRDGFIRGDDGNNNIDGAFNEPGVSSNSRDRIDNNDAILNGASRNDDFVIARGGNDTVKAGEGNDIVFGGRGNDQIYGGNANDQLFGEAGNDTIYGDAGNDLIYGDGGSESKRGAFKWSEIKNGNNSIVDGGSLSNRVLEQSFDGVTVQVTVPRNTSTSVSTFENDRIYVDRIETDGGSVNSRSSLSHIAQHNAAPTSFQVDFSDEVMNVQFNVTDIDVAKPRITVLAWDTEGNRVFVQLVAGSSLTTSNLDPYGPENDKETATGNSSDADPNAASHSVTVIIPGPVSKIEIIHEATASSGQSGVHISDIYFDSVGAEFSGDDYLDGGAGSDTIYGGLGNDTLIGGGGDLLYGGGGADRFNVVHDTGLGAPKDQVTTIYGGSGEYDNDKIDLSGLRAAGFSETDVVEWVPENQGRPGHNGKIVLKNPTTGHTHTIIFEDIEEFQNNDPSCFTPGTLIATPAGEIPVEKLKVGDRVITRDHGLQEIRWIGAQYCSARRLVRSPQLLPVLIRQGALGNGQPQRDLMVSPNHRMLICSDRSLLYFEDSEVLVAAKHLVGQPGIEIAQCPDVTYVHFLLDRHEVVLAEGCWSESFQPGDYTLSSMDEAQRQEIFELFPELATETGQVAYLSARRSLKRREAQALLR